MPVVFLCDTCRSARYENDDRIEYRQVSLRCCKCREQEALAIVQKLRSAFKGWIYNIMFCGNDEWRENVCKAINKMQRERQRISSMSADARQLVRCVQDGIRRFDETEAV